MNLFKKLTEGDNRYFFKMFTFMKPYKFGYAISQIIYSSQGFVFPLIIAIFSENLMAAIISQNSDAVVSAGITLATMIGIFIAVLIVGIYINIIVIERATLDLKKRLFRLFVKISPEDSAHSGEGIASLNTDADAALGVFETALMRLISAVFAIVGSSIAIFIADWRLGIACIVVGILGFFMQNRYTEPLATIGKKTLEANEHAVKSTSNIFAGAIAIRAYNMQPQTLVAFDTDNSRIQTLNFKEGIIRMGQNIFNTVQGWLTIMTVFGFGSWLAANGYIDFATVAFVFTMSSTLTHSISSLGEIYARLQPHIAGAKRVFAVLEAEKNNPQKTKTDAVAKGYDIRIKNLNFYYADTEAAALQNINLDIRENQMVAFVGDSGSGKSTLLRTIIGMYEREDLGITLGDISFNDVSTKSWRKHFAYVDQNCNLFNISVKENISMGAMGASDEKIKDEDIVEAAKAALAHDFIENLPEKYDTLCGEKGDGLSGGEKQRVAIARALIKKAPVLVFDEITASLDKETEKQILNTIKSLRKTHTILISTHNLESVADADIVVRLENGKMQ
ncbi:MAG: ABC transporter ATP-binding protein/permease [Defluviitaleaceae bacterium]|nr:ABC transporter ATP-binding protein/permease [Defluviitaleaceae bacterium]